ncbi:MAG: heme-binding domain-containing protein, partial [Planctomycetes bacterium]|nr:heme-binding domain-containing protein [Planctomycetota bacterium]
MASMSRQQQIDLIRFLSELGKEGVLTSSTMETLLKHAQFSGPARFPYDNRPLHPDRWPNAGHRINRDRIYDFYTKQAEYFRKQHPVPQLLMEFPGLDGGLTGHWGNQTEPDWVDGRWNETQLGSLQSGIFISDKLIVGRSNCLRLGDRSGISACFDPDTLTYRAVWKDGFVTFSDVRHGFVHGLIRSGELLPLPEQATPKEPFRYRGCYRHGSRVLFKYSIGDTEYLDAPWVENGAFVREVAPVSEHSKRDWINGGPSQWPEEITTSIKHGTGRPYSIDTVELPTKNPWKSLIFCGGHDFLPNGDALVCTMQGDVWRVQGLDGPTNQDGMARWRRVASGLHHALGLVVSGNDVFVQCRDQLTRLHDLNHDGEYDFYECYSNAFKTSPAGHDYICGLERDKSGNFYTASGNQGLVRISPDGKEAIVLATGFRNPDGLGLYPDGTVTVPCSEGEWTPSSMICAVQPKEQTDVGNEDSHGVPHFGYRGPLKGAVPSLPFVYLPR